MSEYADIIYRFKIGGTMVKIYIEDKIIEYENKKEEIDNILGNIDDLVEKSGKTLSHIIIDGIELYNSYKDYFQDNIDYIEKVKVIALTYEELVGDILVSTLEYLDRTPEVIEGLANSFYRNPNKESWNDLSDLLGAISWIINTFTSIDKDNRLKAVVSDYEGWNNYAAEVITLGDTLNELEEALSNRDYVSIADILSYEIGTLFKQMSSTLSTFVHREVDLRDLN